MKKFGLFIFTILAAAALSACNDVSGDYPANQEFVTVRTVLNDFYFERANGQTIYPGDKSRIGAYEAKNNQRALVAFTPLPDKKEGFDYNAAIYYIQNIYTGSSEIIETQEDLDALKDDKADYSDAMLTSKHLTMIVRYAVVDNTKHNFKLIYNDVTEPKETAEGYLNVEFRHDAGGETTGNMKYNYVSFDVNALTTLMAGKKGLLIRFNSLDKDVRYQKVNLMTTEN